MKESGQLLTERDQGKLERKLINEFIKEKNLSKYDKETLRKLKVILKLNYNFYKGEFYSYLMENQASLNNFINKLDKISKEVVNSAIQDIKFINTHSFIEILKALLKKKNEIMNYLKIMKSFTHLKLHENLYEQSVFYYKHGLTYLSDEVLKFLNDKDFLDCGAYVGDSALIFEKFYNPNKIYSFEPDDENYNFLLNTIKLNNLKKIIPVKLGVGAKDSTKNFLHCTGASHITDDDSEININITSIDNFISDKDVDVGLIKIDVEGYELEAIEGAKKTIRKFKPVLLISIYHNAEQFINTMSYIKKLVPEYEIIIRHLEDLLPVSETMLIAWQNTEI
ncbi:MAG: FkbM family methyltransferase [Candidatus Hermodarchaeota archaeon]